MKYERRRRPNPPSSLEDGASPFSPKIEGERIFSGNVYFFKYKPYTPDYRRPKKLPFWDKTPLFLMFNYISDKKCVFGVNLHYVIGDERKELLKYIWGESKDIDLIQWKNDYEKRRGGMFSYLPVALRLYKITNMSNLEKVMDLHLDSEDEFEKTYDTLDKKYRMKLMQEGERVPTTEHLKKMMELANKGEAWWNYYHDIFIKGT